MFNATTFTDYEIESKTDFETKFSEDSEKFQPVKFGSDYLTPKQFDFLLQQRNAKNGIPTPFVLTDLDIIENNYTKMKKSFDDYNIHTRIHYAIKASPENEIVNLLKNLHSSFDTASRNEIIKCLNLGVSPSNISFGNTIKKSEDISYAYEKGIRLYVFDSREELVKLSKYAPGCDVYCRILIDTPGADWPLSRKFGCSPKMAFELMIFAKEMGLNPVGISFHVGSQQTNLNSWDIAFKECSILYKELSAYDIHCEMINIGGGFPCRYQTKIHSSETYTKTVVASFRKYFGEQDILLLLEPGRSLVANAGVLETQVVLFSSKDSLDSKKWLYLDVGTYTGLSEVLGESIKYRFMVPDYCSDENVPVVIAGPTCDSTDILYEKSPYVMPVDLSEGDRITMLCCGAYTVSCSSVGFNGFEPIKNFCI